MRIAFLSDIHGNREALEACLSHVARQGYDKLWPISSARVRRAFLAIMMLQQLQD